MRLLSLVLIAFCVACEPAELEGPAPAEHGERPTDALMARAYDLAKERGQAYEFETSGELELIEGQVRNEPWMVMGGRCYVVAAASEGRELSLSVLGSENAPLAQDGDDGPDAFVGSPHAICPPTPAQYRLRFRLSEGEGRVVYRIHGRHPL